MYNSLYLVCNYEYGSYDLFFFIVQIQLCVTLSEFKGYIRKKNTRQSHEIQFFSSKFNTIFNKNVTVLRFLTEKSKLNF